VIEYNVHFYIDVRTPHWTLYMSSADMEVKLSAQEHEVTA